MEKRGYLNPNHKDDNTLPEEEPMESGMVMVDIDRYDALVTAAAALNILTADLKKHGYVNNDIVYAVTGFKTDKQTEELQATADTYWRYYLDEKKKSEELAAQVDKLDRARLDLVEILRQNGISQIEEEDTRGEG